MERVVKSAAQTYGKGVFAKHIRNYEPKDPMYESYQDESGREKRRRREVPPGLSKRDQKILRAVQRRAHYLDKGFRMCGMRFGWTFLIGLIPVVGDVTDAALNYSLVVRKARQAELPDWLVRRMMLNNAFSAAVGFVPFVGDVVLASFKANSRNAWLLEEFLRIRGEELLKAQAAREQDAQEIKPGAGTEPGEVVPGAGTQGAPPKKGSAFGSMFRKSPPAEKGKQAAGASASTQAAPATDAAAMPGTLPPKKS